MGHFKTFVQCLKFDFTVAWIPPTFLKIKFYTDVLRFVHVHREHEYFSYKVSHIWMKKQALHHWFRAKSLKHKDIFCWIITWEQDLCSMYRLASVIRHLSTGLLLTPKISVKPSLVITAKTDDMQQVWENVNTRSIQSVTNWRNQYAQHPYIAFFSLPSQLAKWVPSRRLPHKVNLHLFYHQYEFVGPPIVTSLSKLQNISLTKTRWAKSE
jgi:hypothetical protein